MVEEALNILYKGIAPNPTANNECIELCKKDIEKQIPNEYCAMCGEKITRTSKERGGKK